HRCNLDRLERCMLQVVLPDGLPEFINLFLEDRIALMGRMEAAVCLTTQLALHAHRHERQGDVYGFISSIVQHTVAPSNSLSSSMRARDTARKRSRLSLL